MQKDQCYQETASQIQSANLSDNKIGEANIKKINIDGQIWYQIDQRHLPLIFQFDYSALLQVKMSNDKTVSEYAHWLFGMLIKRIINRCHSHRSKKNIFTRMKTEEKVKFLIRSFEIKYVKQNNLVVYERMKKFNSKNQQQFFQKPQVKQYFLKYLPIIIEQKKNSNDHRIRQIENLIIDNLRIGESSPKRGYIHYASSIQKIQLPWTDNMFSDIHNFGVKLCSSYDTGFKDITQSYVKYSNDEEQEEDLDLC